MESSKRFPGRSQSPVEETLNHAAYQFKLTSEKDSEKLIGYKKKNRKTKIYSSLEEKADAYLDSREWDFDQAVSNYIFALESNNLSADSKSRINNKIGQLCLSRNKHKSALFYFEKTILENPQNSAAYHGIATINFMANNFENSIVYCNKAIQNISSLSLLCSTANKLHHLNCMLLRAISLFKQNNIIEAFSDYKNILNTIVTKDDLNTKEVHEFRTIRKHARGDLYILLTSSADLSKISEHAILDIIQEYSINERLKLLNMCRDPETALGKRMKISVKPGRDIDISFFHNEKISDTQARIHEMILEIKLRQAEKLNQEFASDACSRIIDSETESDSSDNDLWIQKSDEVNESYHLTNLKK